MTDRIDNPFSDDLFIDHPDNLPGVARIHHEAFHRLVEAVEYFANHSSGLNPADQIGRLILMTAPRAGYGKTHLAARLRQQLKSSAIPITLTIDPSRAVTWPAMLGATMRQAASEASTRDGANSLFDEIGRFFLAHVILSHLEAETLEASQCPATAEQLRSEFAFLFQPKSPTGALDWMGTKGRQLAREVGPVFSRKIGISAAEVSFWAGLLIDYQRLGDAALEPLRGLSNGEARERLLQWLRISAFYRPILLIADHLDGFFASETAGMEIAGLLTSIRESVPRSISLLCLNEDVWAATFERHLPSAWIDRLVGEPEKLRHISPEVAADLIRMRLERISASPSVAATVIQKLSDEHLWVDPESSLTPRRVLRQASELWKREGVALIRNAEARPTALQEKLPETPLKEITDKVAFFTALQSDCDAAAEAPQSTPPPSTPPLEDVAPPKAEPPSGIIPIREEIPENPFFAPEEPKPEIEAIDPASLAGIDTIIDDIRDSGYTVASESDATAPIAPPQRPNPSEISTMQYGDLTVKSTPPTEPPSSQPIGAPLFEPPSEAKNPPPPILNQIVVEDMIAKEEQALLANLPLQLDLTRLASFLSTLGACHEGLGQTEERFAGAQSVSLRWNVRGQSVLLSFESPNNVYFWNHLLQQSLASNRREKLTAFSHESEPFDPSLFSSFGFSPAVAKSRIDIVEMTNTDLALLQAAEEVMHRIADAPDAGFGAQIISRRLDPLWRRISKPI